MQEIKTLATCNVTSNEESDAFDKEVNALLADGWTVAASSITTTTGPVYTFASMVLIRDIMATEPAPVETPSNDNAIPKTMREFVIGQTVRVRDDVDGEALGYTGRTGQVTHLDRSRASGVVRYFTTLSTHDAFYADELEPAETPRKFNPGDRVCIAVADEPYYQNRKATVQDISIFTCDIKLDAVGAETEEDREVITIEYKRLEPAD